MDGGAAGSFVSNLIQGIWAANDSNPYSANCLSGRYLRDDVLVVRHTGGMLPDADGNLPYAATLRPNTFYFHSCFGWGEVFQGMTPPNHQKCVDIYDFPMQEYVYYIGRDDADSSLPALRRIALKGNGDTCNGTSLSVALMCDEMVTSGIERMQLQFGHKPTNSLMQYHNADQIGGRSSDLVKTDWEEVRSVRIWLLARSATSDPGYTNDNSYDMGDVTYQPNDGYRRQLFTAIVKLRNMQLQD